MDGEAALLYKYSEIFFGRHDCEQMIEAALYESRGRIAGPRGAAEKLGMPRTTLEYQIRALRINKHKFKIGFSA
jgi:transcriptional regulator with GAF, ATPase, and Fis domain